MGNEWLFKSDFIDVILLSELGHNKLAEKRLQIVSNTYNELLDDALYQRVKIFIGFIFEYFENPKSVRKSDFAERVLSAKLGLEGQAEDIQAILFFCWLRSKMQGRKCYEVFLERVGEGM